MSGFNFTLEGRHFSGAGENSIVMQVFSFNADSSIFLEQISKGNETLSDVKERLLE